MSNKPLVVAQIGYGYWGPNLLRNLAHHDLCRVKTVVDLSPERREVIKKNYPEIHVAADIAEAFDDSEIQAVVIATPASTHFDLAVSCMNKGKHILVEKPLACSVAEVDVIKKVSLEKKLVAMAAHTFIYNDAVRFLKKLIDQGDLGDIRYIYSQRLNLGRIRSDVDALWNLAPHDISIIQYLLNNAAPEKIVRQGMDYIQKGIDDVVFLQMIYPGKIMAQVHVSWLDPHKVRQMTVVGSKKMVVYDDVADQKITIFDKGIDPLAILGQNMDFDKPGPQSFTHRSGDIFCPAFKFREPLRVEIDHFFECILKGTPCLTGPDHAREVVRILECHS